MLRVVRAAMNLNAVNVLRTRDLRFDEVRGRQLVPVACKLVVNIAERFSGENFNGVVSCALRTGPTYT